MNRNHRLTDAELDQLSRGLGDRVVVRRLRVAQVSKRLLQLRALLDALDPAQVAHLYDLFVEADRRSPGAARAVLAQPHAGAWLASALRDVRGTWPVPHRPVAVHLRHLGALAVATALRAGLEFKAELEPTDGVVMLPGLGSATVGAAATVIVSHIHGDVQVGPVQLPTGPLETVTAGWRSGASPPTPRVCPCRCGWTTSSRTGTATASPPPAAWTPHRPSPGSGCSSRHGIFWYGTIAHMRRRSRKVWRRSCHCTRSGRMSA